MKSVGLPKRGLMRRMLLCAALPIFLVASPAAAQEARSLLDQARQAAQSDRNRESADLFRRAIEADPNLRPQVLREYADQLTYSDRAGEAVPLYREVLASPALPPEERRRAMQGLALALAWSGQHEGAVRAYSEIIAADPADRQALIGRGRVQTWRNSYRAAEADFRRALVGDPGNEEALRGLAEAQSLQGHHREAIATLVPSPAKAPTRPPSTSWPGRKAGSAGPSWQK